MSTKKISSIKHEWLSAQVKLLTIQGMSKAEIARKADVMPQYLNSILSGSRGVTDDFIDKFCEAFDINHFDLFNIQGELQQPLPIARPAHKPNEGIPLLPVEAMAGALTGETSILEHECERYVIPVFNGADFLIPVKGSSMYPKYSSGDIVACKRIPMTDIFFQWNKVYVIDTSQGALIKRIKPGSDKEHVLIVSDNENYEPFELPYTAIYSVALVIGVIRLE